MGHDSDPTAGSGPAGEIIERTIERTAGTASAEPAGVRVRMPVKVGDVLARPSTCVEVLPRGATRSILAITAAPNPGPRLRPCRRPLTGPVIILVGAPGGVLKLSAVVGDALDDSSHPLELIRLVEKIERRGDPRVTLDTIHAVVRRVGQQDVVASSPVDVSLGGIALPGVDAAPDDLLDVELTVALPTGPVRLVCTARVVHRRHDEESGALVGCRWVDPTRSFRTMLSSIIATGLSHALRR